MGFYFNIDSITPSKGGSGGGGGGGSADTITAINKTNSNIIAGKKVWIEQGFQTNFSTSGTPNIDYDTMIYITDGYSNAILIPDFTERPEGSTTIPYNVDFQIVLKLKKTQAFLVNSNTYAILQTEDWNDYSSSNKYAQVRMCLDYYMGLHTYSTQSGDSHSQVSSFLDSTSLRDLPIGTYFYARLRSSIDTSGRFYIGLSKDGINYKEDGINISSWFADGLKWTAGKGLYLFGQSANPAFSLEDCQFKYGNITWTPLASSVYFIKDFYKTTQNFITNGSLTTTNNGISGFSTSNFLKLKKAFNPQNKTWEVPCKFTTPNVSTQQSIFKSGISAPEAAGRLGIGVEINETHFRISASSNGTSWDLAHDIVGTYTLSANTAYWIKLGWDGTQYYLDYSLDGETYTRDITITNSTAIYGSLGVTLFGLNWWTDAYQAPFLGTIDLSETYIIIDDKLFWTPYTNVTHDAITGVAQENITVDTSGTIETILE